MLSDQSKVVLLFCCFLGCLGTIFTSNSFLTGGALRTLNPPLQRLCRKAREEAKHCLEGSNRRLGSRSSDDGPSKSCAALLSAAGTCERAVTKAYRHINMSACVRDIQAKTVCELEWCEDVPDTAQAHKDCKTECEPVREALSKCEHRHVVRYFQSYGLRSDGTEKS